MDSLDFFTNYLGSHGYEIPNSGASSSEKSIKLENKAQKSRDKDYFAAASRKSRKRKLEKETALARRNEQIENERSLLKIKMKMLQDEFEVLNSLESVQNGQRTALFLENLCLRNQLQGMRSFNKMIKTRFQDFSRINQSWDDTSKLCKNIGFLFNKLHVIKSLVYRRPCNPFNPKIYDEIRRKAWKFLDDPCVKARVKENAKFGQLNLNNVKTEVRYLQDVNGAKYVRADIFDVPVDPSVVERFYDDTDRFNNALRFFHMLKDPSKREYHPKLETYIPSSEADAALEKYNLRYSRAQGFTSLKDCTVVSVSDKDAESKVFIRSNVPNAYSDFSEIDSVEGVFMRGIICSEGAHQGHSNLTFILSMGCNQNIVPIPAFLEYSPEQNLFKLESMLNLMLLAANDLDAFASY